MTKYIVTYSDPDATFPAPNMEGLVECSKEEIWDKALELGFVKRIFDLDMAGCLYSIHWDHNHLGLTKAQINDNLGFK